MNKRAKEFLNGIGMLATAIAMIFIGSGIIFLLMKVYHAIFK